VADGVGERRWYAKKVSRGTMMLGAWATGSAPLRNALARGGGVRVLTYHRFGDWPRDPFCVAARDFERQVRWVAERGLAVSLADLRAFLRGERRLPEGAVLLTADDGARSVLSVAAPILREHGVPMVAFLTTGALDGLATRLALPEPFLSWDEAGRLGEHGIEVGSHGLTHGSLGTMTEAQVREEGERSREAIRRELGCVPTSFAYPYGTPAHYGTMTRRVLAGCGYDTLFLSTHGAVRAGCDPLALPRVKVEGGEPMWLFRLLARGGMDDWRYVDRALALLTRAGRARATAA
jgi:peptidoglycan/xylan/chitin deacetylase (PgdA/CDA1 family)